MARKELDVIAAVRSPLFNMPLNFMSHTKRNRIRDYVLISKLQILDLDPIQILSYRDHCPLMRSAIDISDIGFIVKHYSIADKAIALKGMHDPIQTSREKCSTAQ